MQGRATTNKAEAAQMIIEDQLKMVVTKGSKKFWKCSDNGLLPKA